MREETESNGKGGAELCRASKVRAGKLNSNLESNFVQKMSFKKHLYFVVNGRLLCKQHSLLQKLFPHPQACQRNKHKVD